MVPIVAQAEYGLSEMFSIGFVLNYGLGIEQPSGCPTGFNCSTTTVRGFFDPTFDIKGRVNWGAGTLLYGLIADIGVEKNQISATGNSNTATFGITLDPFVAYQLQIGRMIYGLRVQYDVLKDGQKTQDESVSPTSTSTSTGGNTYIEDLYYEYALSHFTFGGSLMLGFTENSKTWTDGNPAVTQGNDSSLYGIDLYAAVPLKDVTILPNVSYTYQKYESDQSILTDEKRFQVGVAARFAL